MTSMLYAETLFRRARELRLGLRSHVGLEATTTVVVPAALFADRVPDWAVWVGCVRDRAGGRGEAI